MPRFVLLDHDHPHPHLDLMFEVGEVLWTWQLEAWPAEGQVVPAVRIFDHRPVYLDYEGPISGGLGRVRRVERGEFEWLEVGEGRLVAELRGERLVGRLEVVQVAPERWEVRHVSSAPS